MVTIKYKESFKKDYFETQAWQENTLICGIDEVGRGCLAGPIVTAAVILFPHKKSRLIKDSKLLDGKELQLAYRWLLKNCWFSYAILNHRSITQHNIYYATMKAMRRALMQLFAHCPQLPKTIVIDAMPVNLTKTPYETITVYHFPFGERKSSSIAAASIIAKVTRDAIMRKLDTSFPMYHFAKHKGYSTKLHQHRIKTYGPSIIHREHFLDNKSWLAQEQLALQFDLDSQSSEPVSESLI
jgi:ribonuclease HII